MSFELVLTDYVVDIEPVPSHPTLLWAIGPDQLWSSVDAGANWQSHQAPPGAGYYATIAPLPGRPRSLIVGDTEGEKWITHDGGLHWRELSGLPEALGIGQLTTTTGDPESILLGSSNGFGLWRSTDEGTSWHQRSNGLAVAVTALVIDSLRSGVAYAKGNGGGLFVTEDSGLSWDAVMDMPGRAVHLGSISGLRDSSAQLVVSEFSGDGPRLLKFTGDTSEWQEFGPAIPLGGSPVLGTGPGWMYVKPRGRPELAASSDGGLEWTIAQAGGHTKIGVNQRLPSRAHAAGAGGHYRTVDGGSSWTRIGLTFHLSDLAIHTLDSRRLYAVSSAGPTSQGFFRSKDSGTTWARITTGLPDDARLNRLAVDDRHPQRVWVGSSTLPSLWLSEDGGLSFARIPAPGPKFGTTLLGPVPGNLGDVWVVDRAGAIWSVQL